MKERTEYETRRGHLRSGLKDARADAFLVSALPNVRYLTGFSGSNGMLVLTPDRELLFTDPRYQTQASLESDCEVKVAKNSLLNEVLKWLERLQIRRLAFELTRLRFEHYRELKSAKQKLLLRPVRDSVELLRMVKSDVEIATIRTSVQLNSHALDQALSHFEPSMTEVDLAAEIEYRMRRLGANGSAFSTIVASGERGALPHAHPTLQSIGANQLLLIDMGAMVAGYASDMTRTYAIGKVAPRLRRMYKAVLESQLAAIDAIQPGISCDAVDRMARKVLKAHQLDRFFIHSTGHGLGLEIHEGPRMGRKEKTKLVEGMTITVEPGVYIEGLGGVRIEDTVVVTANGCEVLTPTGKELTVL